MVIFEDYFAIFPFKQLSPLKVFVTIFSIFVENKIYDINEDRNQSKNKRSDHWRQF